MTALILLLAGLAGAPGGFARSSTATPRCSTKAYGLELAPLSARSSKNGLVITAGWLTGSENRHPCSLNTTIRVAILSSGGAAGPTTSWTVRQLLQPWSEVVHTWVWQNWCPPAVRLTVRLSLPGGQVTGQRVPQAPPCVTPGSPSAIVDRGTGTRYVAQPSGRIPPHILPSGTPPPLPASVIHVTNAWLVSDGYTLVAVYAGAAGNDPAEGRFAVIRQNEIFGIQYEPPDIVDVGKVGRVRITAAPTGRKHETSAQHGVLRFSSRRGSQGVLELRDDRVERGM